MAWTGDMWSSLAFVVAGAWILVTAGRDQGDDDGPGSRTALGLLAVLVGVGSVVQHGPAPSWNPVLHDPPLLGAYALVAADSTADLLGRRMRTWWWLAPTLADVVLAAAWPEASMVAQGATAAIAVVLVLARAARRPAVRARLLTALGLLAVGSVAGELSRSGRPWAVWDGLDGGALGVLTGHAVWHVLAAVAIAAVAPTLGSRPAPGQHEARRRSVHRRASSRSRPE